MKTLLLIIVLSYTFIEVHTISGRSAFSWGSTITHTDTIKHVNSPVLKSDTVYVDENGWRHEIKIEKIIINYK